MANGRKQKNMIVKQVSEGVIFRDKVGIKSVVAEYFHKLFRSKDAEMELILQCVRPKVTEAHNIDLTK